MGTGSERLRWPRAAGWVASVRARLVGAAGEEVYERFQRFPPAPNRAGDEAWLALILGPESRVEPGELVDALVAELRNRYRVVRAYHAGRPVDPEAYLRHGLLVATPERLIGDAGEIFAGEEAALAALLPRQHLSLVDGHVALHLDERFLLHCFTFYALYGSHFLLGLGVQIEKEIGRPMRGRLKARGVPTIAACDVPIDRLPRSELRQLACQGIRAALASSDGGPLEVTDFGLTLDRPLPPESVITCRHPRRLVDFLGSGPTFS